MGDPIHEAATAVEPLTEVYRAAGPYLDTLAARPVLDGSALPMLAELGGALPEDGVGGSAAITRLLRVGTAAATHSSGPRFYHLVIGGATPAAMAADWVVSLLDQNAAARAASALATEAETVVLRWLRELFGLPAGWGGALVASATFANFTGLACATHWWAGRYGVDAATEGLAGLPRMPVLSGGYVHPSARKALQMLGHGSRTVEVYARDAAGRVDVPALRRRLAELAEGTAGRTVGPGGVPAVIIANAGEVNTGDFDPIGQLADVADEFGAWLHVDGAFGLFAALSPRTAHLVSGVDRARSVAADAHKWLNVPYESGFAFVAEPERLGRAFGMPGAPYLPRPDSSGGGYMHLGPESSRRARALPIWATLAAYGRSGYRAMVERHLDLARHLAARIEAADDMELLAEVPLCVVCFRYRPPDVPEEDLDELNVRLAQAILDDGRFLAGGTTYQGRSALRPAITNWRVTEAQLDEFVTVVRELGTGLAGP